MRIHAEVFHAWSRQTQAPLLHRSLTEFSGDAFSLRPSSEVSFRASYRRSALNALPPRSQAN